MTTPTPRTLTVEGITGAPRTVPCPHDGIRHTDQGTLTVRDPDDEIVGCGFIHVERMGRNSVWIGMEAADGTRVDLDLFAVGKGKLRMLVR